MKILSKSFFNYYIIHPFSKKLSTSDKVIAAIASTIFLVLTFGILHGRAYFKGRRINQHHSLRLPLETQVNKMGNHEHAVRSDNPRNTLNQGIDAKINQPDGWGNDKAIHLKKNLPPVMGSRLIDKSSPLTSNSPVGKIAKTIFNKRKFMPVYFNVASYNILAPIFAIKWREFPGLNEKGQSATIEELRNSLNNMEWKGYSNWDKRSITIAENIQRADIVCVQEITRETLETLSRLTGYSLAAPVFHTTRDPIQEYGNAIFYNPNKVELLKEHSVTHRDGNNNREAACASFRMGERIVKVASVHLTGFWPEQPDLQKKLESKQKGVEELRSYIKSVEQDLSDVDCLVIAGDFNESVEEADCPFYRPNLLREAGYEFDGSVEFTEPAKKRKIDWIAVKPLKGDLRLMPMGLESIQKQASDHLMTGTAIA